MERKATFGAGCFWGVEAAFRRIDGVSQTRVGYAGGVVENPSYEQVCHDGTGHAEVVEVTYDAALVPYQQLLAVFWAQLDPNQHDPTQLDRQGPDVGSQYRSVIFAHDEEQRLAAQASRDRIGQHLSRPVATQIEDAPPFWEAEDYHQQYLEKRGLASCPPRLASAA